MKEKRILKALGQVDEKYIEEVAPKAAPVKKHGWVKWCAAAACLALVLSLGISMLNNQKNAISLSDASYKVSVKRTDKALDIASAPALADLSEEELFTAFNTAVFKGMVMKIDNIVVDYNGSKDYRAIAQIKVDRVYRGNCQEGETVSVLLPCPIAGGIWVEDTETLSAMSLGTTGIFMPMQYDASSIREENGARLALKDLADYGFADGSRYAFLETDSGLIFSRWAYESIATASTLEEIEEYVLKMLDK